MCDGVRNIGQLQSVVMLWVPVCAVGLLLLVSVCKHAPCPLSLVESSLLCIRCYASCFTCLLLHAVLLFLKDKNSPLPPQDTQPLVELAQNSMHPASHVPQMDFAPHMWPDKQHQIHQPQHMNSLDQHHATDQYLLQSPGMSPMSMELTNDTLQQQAAGLLPFCGK